MAKLMTGGVVRYVLKHERDLPEGEQTVFHIQGLSFKQRARVQDEVIVTEIKMLGPKNQSGTGVMKHLGGTQAKTAIEHGLVKIENLRRHDGELARYEADSQWSAKEEILDLMPPEWLREVAEEILKMSGLLKEEEKN